MTKLPIILKGVSTAEDARLAVQHEVDGIIVSNHGGRQLDTVAATVRQCNYSRYYSQVVVPTLKQGVSQDSKSGRPKYVCVCVWAAFTKKILYMRNE